MFESPFPAQVGYAAVQASVLEEEQPHPQEMAALGPQAQASRRRSFALGRIAARRALAHLTPQPRPVLPGPDRAPRWPEGVAGSITHVADWAIAAAAESARTIALGLDLAWLPDLRTPSIARLIADDDERRWIDGDARRLLALFSAKESIFKALYPAHGAYFGFDAATLRWTEESGGRFDARLLRPLGPRWPDGMRLPVGVRWNGDFVFTWVWLPHESPPR